MKKDNKKRSSPSPGSRWKPQRAKKLPSITIGMDLGDKRSRYCVMEEEQVVREESVASSKKGLAQVFSRYPRCRIALEVGTHSPWVSRLLNSLGHEVIVANPRQLQLITQSSRKNDKVDARTLARLARLDPDLLRPIQHRSEKAQMDLMRVRVRAQLVEMRTMLVNSLRGFVKSVGERVAPCDPENLDGQHVEDLPEPLRDVLKPLVDQVQGLNQQLRECEQQLEQIARNEYPETQLLRQVHGVGTLIALTFRLTLEDPHRFGKSRDVSTSMSNRSRMAFAYSARFRR